jgi:hypothetical protein
MANRVDLTVSIDLPPNHNADKVSLGPDGQIKFFDKSGNEIAPSQVTRAAHYDRPKCRKYQARSEGEHASVGGLEELASFDSFVAIDTNSVEIDGAKVSAACFMALTLIAEKGEFHLKSLDERHHVYEFHHVSGNPEMLAILKVACDTLRTRGPLGKSKIAFITDSDLDKHHAISTQKHQFMVRTICPKGLCSVTRAPIQAKSR